MFQRRKNVPTPSSSLRQSKLECFDTDEIFNGQFTLEKFSAAKTLSSAAVAGLDLALWPIKQQRRYLFKFI
jgi:hypothetical protein